MPFHIGVFGNGAVYLTPPANVPNGTRAYVYLLTESEDPVSFFRRLVLLEPEDARLYNQLGLAQMEAGRLADGEASFSRAISLDFSFAEAHLNLGRCYERQNQLDSALLSYRKAVDLASNEAAVHRPLIALLLRLDRHDDSLAALAEGVRAAPRLRPWAETDEALAALRADSRWNELMAIEES